MLRLMRKAQAVIPAQRLWINPDCGLKTRGWKEVEAALRNMVGVYEWEREAVRPLVFDLRLESEQPPDLTRVAIEQHLAGWLAPCRYRLLEALAEHLESRIIAEWQCSRVVLGIEKPGALGDLARVGIRIARSA